MAAAFSGENGRPSRRAPSPRSRQRAAQAQPATSNEVHRGTRTLQSRLSASSSREHSSFFRLSSATISPRNLRGLPPRGDTGGGSRGSEGGVGGIGGVWASIVSLGAATLPASLAMPSPPSSTTYGSEGSRHEAEAANGAGPRARERNASVSPMSSSSPSSGMLRAAIEDTEEVDGEGGRVGAAVVPPLAAADAAVDAGVPREASGARGSALQNASVGGTSASVPASTSSEKKAVPVIQKHVYLDGASAVYTCAVCRAHLATRDHVVSECFHGHGGRAFLFERCVNVKAGRPEDRLLMTGMHVVADISCSDCGTELGWKYEEAAEKSQKYKEGKFILEKCSVTLEGCDGDARYGPGRGGSNSIIGWGAEQAPFADFGKW